MLKMYNLTNFVTIFASLSLTLSYEEASTYEDFHRIFKVPKKNPDSKQAVANAQVMLHMNQPNYYYPHHGFVPFPPKYFLQIPFFPYLDFPPNIQHIRMQPNLAETLNKKLPRTNHQIDLSSDTVQKNKQLSLSPIDKGSLKERALEDQGSPDLKQLG